LINEFQIRYEPYRISEPGLVMVSCSLYNLIR
jgi:hypothetical protein